MQGSARRLVLGLLFAGCTGSGLPGSGLFGGLPEDAGPAGVEAGVVEASSAAVAVDGAAADGGQILIPEGLGPAGAGGRGGAPMVGSLGGAITATDAGGSGAGGAMVAADAGGSGAGGAMVDAGAGGTGGGSMQMPGVGGAAGAVVEIDAAAGSDATFVAVDAARMDRLIDAPSSDPADAGRPIDAPVPTSPGFPGCPGCKPIFDGKSLGPWQQSPPDSWVPKDGAMASTGGGRGYIATLADYGDFRLIFSVKQVSGNHSPCILLFGSRSPVSSTLGAIQFQPPNGATWDYRPGENNTGGSAVTRLPHPLFDVHQWSQCEVLVKASTGEARMACCQLTGSTPCRAVEVVRFKDPTAGRRGPVAWQMHNLGLFDLYRDVFVEENGALDDFITTK